MLTVCLSNVCISSKIKDLCCSGTGQGIANLQKHGCRPAQQLDIAVVEKKILLLFNEKDLPLFRSTTLFQKQTIFVVQPQMHYNCPQHKTLSTTRRCSLSTTTTTTNTFFLFQKQDIACFARTTNCYYVF